MNLTGLAHLPAALAQIAACTTYRSSRGEVHQIASMPNGYLHNAAKAAVRDCMSSGRGAATAAALALEVARREA